MHTPEVPLRVTQVVCSDRFFGIERYVVTLARGLAEHGCNVTVIGGPPTRMRRELDGAPVSWYPASGAAAALGQLLRLGRADVIHAHMTHAELAAVLARPVTQARVVVTRHFAARRGSAPGGRLAAMVIRRSVDLQVASSEYVAARVDGASVVVAPGVSTSPPRAKPARAPAVLVLQRLEPAKDTATALRAWAASGLGEGGWTLEVVGDGSDQASLAGLASQLGIESSCRFRGATENVDAWLAQASILLASAPEEPFGLSVLEAMAEGLAIVATGSAGHLETVGRCRGAALFPPGDAEQAAGLLRELAADEARRVTYGCALQTLARDEFTVEREVNEILAAYRSVLAFEGPVAWRSAG